MTNTKISYNININNIYTTYYFFLQKTTVSDNILRFTNYRPASMTIYQQVRHVSPGKFKTMITVSAVK